MEDKSISTIWPLRSAGSGPERTAAPAEGGSAEASQPDGAALIACPGWMGPLDGEPRAEPALVRRHHNSILHQSRQPFVC